MRLQFALATVIISATMVSATSFGVTSKGVERKEFQTSPPSIIEELLKREEMTIEPRPDFPEEWFDDFHARVNPAKGLSSQNQNGERRFTGIYEKFVNYVNSESFDYLRFKNDRAALKHELNQAKSSLKGQTLSDRLSKQIERTERYFKVLSHATDGMINYAANSRPGNREIFKAHELIARGIVMYDQWGVPKANLNSTLVQQLYDACHVLSNEFLALKNHSQVNDFKYYLQVAFKIIRNLRATLNKN